MTADAAEDVPLAHSVKTTGPRIRLSVVIGALCATIVLIVAVITLVITYSVALSTLRDVGLSHSAALAESARYQTQAYFDLPAQQLTTVARSTITGDFRLPRDEADPQSAALVTKLFDLIWPHSSVADFRYAGAGVYFDDGSGSDITTCGFDEGTICSVLYIKGYLRDLTLINKTTWHGYQNPYLTSLYPPYGAAADTPAYQGARAVLMGMSSGMWVPISVLVRPVWTRFTLSAMGPFYNSTGAFLGLISFQMPIEAIADFLQSVRSTEGTQAFAVQADGYLVASTVAAPFYELIPKNASITPDPGCVSSEYTRLSATEPIVHACRKAAASFSAYPPLMIATQDNAFMTTSGTITRRVKADGDNFYVASTAVTNSLAAWSLNIILCVPENDIIGKIVKGRNVAIGVTAAVFVVAAIASFLLVHVLLTPLSDVSARMLNTARLRSSGKVASFSSLREIRDLQRAYVNMNMTIDSFTRYVPRDVVKDLLKSGQLCKIEMTPRYCSMLFVDIAGFTTVCERVPPAILSQLVSDYFDRATKIVMAHDGLVDKFIGDCIMAIWGAPFETPNAEVKSVLTGLLLNRETQVEPLSNSWDEAGEVLRVRVGISTGEILAGNMGSADRMNYTVIGDPVNLAARLESLNKQFGTNVMISEFTAKQLGNLFVLRLLMPVTVVGKEQPVQVFEVVGISDPIDMKVIELLEQNDKMTAVDTETNQSTGLSTVSSSGGAYKKQSVSTMTMIRQALKECGHLLPLACTKEEVAAVNAHSNAVRAYLKGAFGEALQQFQHLSTMPHGTASRSADLVRGLCEQYLREGAPKGFDGTYRALEK